MSNHIIKNVSVTISEGVHRFFLKSSGGNNRAWVKRYRKMIDQYEFLKENATNKQKRDELKGYEKCLKVFYEKVEHTTEV